MKLVLVFLCFLGLKGSRQKRQKGHFDKTFDTTKKGVPKARTLTAIAEVQSATTTIEDPKNPITANSTTAPLTNVNGTLSDQVIREYENAVLQINFLQGERYNNTSYMADMFAVDNQVIGYEWRNGIFLRLPFPTFTSLSDRFASQPGKLKHLIPLFNRFQNRNPDPKQMDCALHMRVLEQSHYQDRFNKIRLIFSSPCVSDTFEKLLIHKAGLRRIVKLNILNREFNIEFRTPSKFLYSEKNLTAFRYEEYRFLKPMHHFVNFINKPYLGDHRLDPNNGQLITPEMRLDHNKKILDDMNEYYKKSHDAINILKLKGKVGMGGESVPVNNIQYNGTEGVSEAQRQQDQNESYYRWSMSNEEVTQIYWVLDRMRNNFNEVNQMCQKICTMEEYFFSWDYCLTTCGLDPYFLSNDDSINPPTNLFPNIEWLKMDKKYEMVRSGGYEQPFWKLDEIQTIWATPQVLTCPQTWTTFDCDF